MSVVTRNLETILVLGNLLGGLRGHLGLVDQSQSHILVLQKLLEGLPANTIE